MARNQTLFLYNGTHPTQDQEWTIYSEEVINKTVTVGAIRKSFTMSLSGDTEIQFGVDDTVYLKANYDYANDTWKTHTNTPNDISASSGQNSLQVTSDYKHELKF